MSALDDIYQLRLQSEESIRSLFQDMDIAAITRGNAPANFKQATPRVEIKLSIGQHNGHRFVCPDGIARFDRWRVTLAVQAVTRPASDGTNALHESFLGRIRNACAVLSQQSWTDFDHFTNVRFAEPLQETNSSGEMKAKEGIEYTVLSYSGTLCIREIAWPIPANVIPVPDGLAKPIDDTGGNPFVDTGGNVIGGF